MKTDKNKFYIIVIICITVIGIFIGGLIYDTINKYNEAVEYENIIDSLKVEISSRDFELEQAIPYYKYDSLENLYTVEKLKYDSIISEAEDSIEILNEELLVCYIKLDRIKEYNRIAAQGNNIIFLRGWINRVLNN
jgi:hypothetical protein